MANCKQQFLVDSLKHLPANNSTSREIGSELKKTLKEQNKNVYGICSYCSACLIPAGTCTVRTISRRSIRKKSKRYRIVDDNKQKKHFLKIHCHTCSRTALYPIGLNKNTKNHKNKPTSTANTSCHSSTPNPSLAVGKPFFTPKRKRSSIGLKATILKQSTPNTPSTPSLQDFLMSTT